jgi:hypothetical protein
MRSEPDSRILKRMGYLADQEGIISRYLREQGGWDSHLLQCRKYITERVKSNAISDITILGSGWLLDVPLEELAELCNSINLIDINHPRQVRRKVKQFKNVNLLKDDITGGLINDIFKLCSSLPCSLDSIEIPSYRFDFDPGTLISLNILTQTDTLLIDYLIKKSRMDIEEQRRFRKRVQEAHLNLLKPYPNLIITDFEEKIIDIDTGAIIETRPLLFTSLPEGNNRQEWEWVFDSSGEYYRRKRVSFKVMALYNSEI